MTVDRRCNLNLMEHPELYIMAKPGISREKLERLNAEADKSAALIPQHAENFDGLGLLPDEFEKARQFKKVLMLRLRLQRLVRFLHR